MSRHQKANTNTIDFQSVGKGTKGIGNPAKTPTSNSVNKFRVLVRISEAEEEQTQVSGLEAKSVQVLKTSLDQVQETSKQ